MDAVLRGFVQCRDCGLLQRLPRLSGGARATCCRCGALQARQRRHGSLLATTCAALGLTLCALAALLPVVSVTLPGGRFAAAHLWTGPTELARHDAEGLSLLVAALFLLPALRLAPVVATPLWRRWGKVPSWLKALARVANDAAEWSMFDVLMLGATVALFRLRVWMRVDFQPGLFAVGGVAWCTIGTELGLEPDLLWRALRPRRLRATPGAPLIGCSSCGLVARCKEGTPCPRCERPLYCRKRASVSVTWALVVAATLLALPANLLPVLTFSKLGRGGPRTIVGGCIELWQRGLWPLALIVVVASVLVPFAKLGALGTLLVQARRGARTRLRTKTRVFRFVAVVGRWSMLDVFATTSLVALARFGWLGSVQPLPGMSAFAGVVILTMLAVRSFDPRLMWDAAGMNEPSAAEERLT